MPCSYTPAKTTRSRSPSGITFRTRRTGSFSRWIRPEPFAWKRTRWETKGSKPTARSSRGTTPGVRTWRRLLPGHGEPERSTVCSTGCTPASTPPGRTLEPDTGWKRKLTPQEAWLPKGFRPDDHKNRVVLGCRKENDEWVVEGHYRLEHTVPWTLGDLRGTETTTHEVKNEFKVRTTGLPLWSRSGIKSLQKLDVPSEVFAHEIRYHNRQTLLIRE